MGSIRIRSNYTGLGVLSYFFLIDLITVRGVPSAVVVSVKTMAPLAADIIYEERTFRLAAAV